MAEFSEHCNRLVGSRLEQLLERDVPRLLRQQAALAAFGSYAFREPVLLNILNEAARVCAEGLAAPFCKICRFREAECDLLIEAGHGWQPGVVGLVVSRADETSPQGRAYITGQPVIIENLHLADVVLPAFYAQHGIISTIDVVIKGIDGEPYGVIEIGSAVQHAYDRHDVDFLTGFANVLAEAVATAQRLTTLRETLSEMQSLIVQKDNLLSERTVLAEELQHRVRNNLQLVHGMLDSYRRLAPASETASINAIIRRVMTLAEVYEQLLGRGLGRMIDFGEYVKALCARMPGLQQDVQGHVVLTCSADVLFVDLDVVTALGMVVAELVSNSYVHAHIGSGGTIDVSLRRSESADEGVLTVRDDGPGFVEQPGTKRHGVGLVRRLVEQVQGSAELRNESGAVWLIRFPVPVLAGHLALMTQS